SFPDCKREKIPLISWLRSEVSSLPFWSWSSTTFCRVQASELSVDDALRKKKKNSLLHGSLAGIMMLPYLYILCVAAGVDSISAVPHTTVSARVGSTVVLPCNLTDVSTQMPHVRWHANRKLVFERSSDDTAVGEGYEGRVDVPEDELRKGNCSLVLKNKKMKKSQMKDHPPQGLFAAEALKPHSVILDSRVHHLPENLYTLHRSLPGIMALLYIHILCVSAFVYSISEVHHITVSAPLGSTVVLPCQLTHAFKQTSAVRWGINNEVVFERSRDGTDVGSGYEGRVDVPEDELRKGNCSLVLKNVRLTDDGVYKPFVMEHMDGAKWEEINKVELSVKVLQNISAAVGSTVVLPCDYRHLSTQTPHVKWYMGLEVVFERQGKESYQGEGYEGRVDVPEDELLKGTCSLVLNNVRVSDGAEYRSSMIVKHTERPVLVQKVQLLVYGD
ncbi:uncharacterized protein DAT39_009808, partial [Clarias magur]